MVSVYFTDQKNQINRDKKGQYFQARYLVRSMESVNHNRPFWGWLCAYHSLEQRFVILFLAPEFVFTRITV